MCTMPGMELGPLTTIERHLRTQCAALDPDAVPLPEVAPLFARLDAILKLAAGAKLRLARKLDDAGAARAAGAGHRRVPGHDHRHRWGRPVTCWPPVNDSPPNTTSTRPSPAGGCRCPGHGGGRRRGRRPHRRTRPVARGGGGAGPEGQVRPDQGQRPPDPAARRDAIRASRSLPDLDRPRRRLAPAPPPPARRRRRDRSPPRPLHPRPPRSGPHIRPTRPATPTGRRHARSGPGHDRRPSRRQPSRHQGVRPHRPRHPPSRPHATRVGLPHRRRRAVDVDHVRSCWEKPSSSRSSTTASTSARSSTWGGRSPPTNARPWKPRLPLRGPRLRRHLGPRDRPPRRLALTGTTTLDELVWLCRHHHDQKTHHHYRITGPPRESRLDEPRRHHPPHQTTTRPGHRPEPSLLALIPP